MTVGCNCITSPCFCDQARSAGISPAPPEQTLASGADGSQAPVDRFGNAMAGMKWLAIGVGVILLLMMFNSARERR